MNAMNPIKLFLSLDMETRLLYMEAFVFLAFARLQKQRSFSKLAPTLGVHMEDSSFEYIETEKKILGKISMAIQIMGKYTFWESNCLVKAIAAMRMLERRNIDSTIYFGTARDENGKMIAHAWLRSGPFYITGSDVKETFVVVSKFSKNKLSDTKGDSYGK